MTFTIITKNGERSFANKELVNISSKDGYDFKADFGFDYLITIEYNKTTGKYSVLNQFNCTKFLFKGQPIPQKLEIEKMCKFMVADSDNFLTIRVDDTQISANIIQETVSEDDVKEMYGNSVNASAMAKLENRKAELEKARVAITKQISFSINDLRNKISMNTKANVFMHIALFVASLVLAFGLSNYLTGLPLKDSASIIQMPVNMKLLLMYTLIVFGVGLIAKQGFCLYLQNKIESNPANVVAEKVMLAFSSILFAAIYCINVLYYIAGNLVFFAIFMSLFFSATTVTLAIACGYFKNNKIELAKELSKYEYREDFEIVIKEYQKWIDRFVNNISAVKIRNIKDKIFMLQLKSIGEICLGIITAPFLAYGVSNTLAMCFPEAAGWIRISGLRFSPVFLTLATFMIIFAFFAFVNAFLCNKKIQASNVIKNDGFSNYLKHGTEIYGLEGIKKLEIDMRRSFTIGLCIIFIEFSMNISYFMQEMGGDLGGMFLSSVAALVPTALLIAETYMLSQTKFDIHTGDELISKMDRE